MNSELGVLLAHALLVSTNVMYSRYLNSLEWSASLSYFARRIMMSSHEYEFRGDDLV